MRTSSRRLASGAAVITSVAAISVALVACGSDDDDTSSSKDGGALDATAFDSGIVSTGDAAPGDAGADATTGDAGSGDAGASDGSATDAAPIDAAAFAVRGMVELTVGYAGPQGAPGSGIIRFVETSSLAIPCTTTAVAGGCSFTSCASESDNIISYVYADAGAGPIAVTFVSPADAGSAADGFIDFAPSDAGPGPYIATDGSIAIPGEFAENLGDQVTATAAGDPSGFGAFSVQATVPGRLTVTAPPLMVRTVGHEGAPGLSSFSFPRQQDLTITFSGGVAGTRARLVLATTGPRSPYPTKRLTCDFDAALGTATIPSQNGLLLLDDVEADAGAAGTLEALGYTDAVVADGTAVIVESVEVDPAQAIEFNTTN